MALVIALAMVVAMALPAFAATQTVGTAAAGKEQSTAEIQVRCQRARHVLYESSGQCALQETVP